MTLPPMAARVSQFGTVPAAHTAAVGGAPTPSAVVPTAVSRKPAPAGPPVRLVLSRLRVSARVVPEAVGPGNALGVPDDPAVLGWWTGGAVPGAGSGSVVIDGHIDSARFGIGVLARLRELRVGDRIEIGAASGRVLRYVVAARRSYLKSTLPAAVFDQAGGERLVLITCGGHFDRQTAHYSDNVVLYAVPEAVS